MIQPNDLHRLDGNDQFGHLRHRMVDQQLRRRNIDDDRVVEAMLSVPREEFVPDSLRSEAYEDWPLPIGYGQTISQPFTVAYMIQALELIGDEKVLEIGTGSGYAAAVLSHVASVVHTVECVAALGEQAQLRLHQLGYDNVFVHIADGSLGLPDHSPFDAIVVAASPEELPEPYAEQLAEGGRIVIPLGTATMSQRLIRFIKCGGGLEAEDLGSFAFVPLIGEDGWNVAHAW